MGEFFGAALNLLEESDSVAASSYRSGTPTCCFNDVVQHGKGAIREGLHLEDTLRAIPKDRL